MRPLLPLVLSWTPPRVPLDQTIPSTYQHCSTLTKRTLDVFSLSECTLSLPLSFLPYLYFLPAISVCTRLVPCTPRDGGRRVGSEGRRMKGEKEKRACTARDNQRVRVNSPRHAFECTTHPYPSTRHQDTQPPGETQIQGSDRVQRSSVRRRLR